MLRRGAGLRHLQMLLGHSSPAITQRYTKVEISDLHEVHRRCHPRDVISHAVDLINFEQLPFELNEPLLDRAFASCFVDGGLDD